VVTLRHGLQRQRLRNLDGHNYAIRRWKFARRYGELHRACCRAATGHRDRNRHAASRSTKKAQANITIVQGAGLSISPATATLAGNQRITLTAS